VQDFSKNQSTQKQKNKLNIIYELIIFAIQANTKIPCDIEIPHFTKIQE